MWLGQYLLQESPKSKVHPELVHPELVHQEKTCNENNDSTKEGNNEETEGRPVRAGRL